MSRIKATFYNEIDGEIKKFLKEEEFEKKYWDDNYELTMTNSNTQRTIYIEVSRGSFCLKVIDNLSNEEIDYKYIYFDPFDFNDFKEKYEVLIKYVEEKS